MAIHVYMSTERGVRQPDGTLAVHPDTLMSYRGEAGPDDDPQRFKQLMAVQGYLVVLLPKRHADGVAPPKRPRRPQQSERLAYRRLVNLEA